MQLSFKLLTYCSVATTKALILVLLVNQGTLRKQIPSLSLVTLDCFDQLLREFTGHQSIYQLKSVKLVPYSKDQETLRKGNQFDKHSSRSYPFRFVHTLARF